MPVFESLSRLLREPEWLLDRLARQMKRAGQSAEGLPAVLEHSGQEGRLLLLLDGLDEVERERRDEAEALLRQVCARWPRTPVVVTSRPIGYRRPDKIRQTSGELADRHLSGAIRSSSPASWDATSGSSSCSPSTAGAGWSSDPAPVERGPRDQAVQFSRGRPWIWLM